MTSPDHIARIRLIRSERVGPVTYFQLISRYGNAETALSALPDLARRGGGKPPRMASRADAEREINAVMKAGAQHLFIGQAGYPPLLAELEDAPPVITFKGHSTLFEKPTIAIVGARNASANAVRFARSLAYDLAQAGITVVSGLARGIDTAAHQGSLEYGTVGVVAGGIDHFYPPENSDLQNRIGNEGALIAEMPPGTTPTARHFPRRNRIISGLSHGIVIVEAAPRSGSLITARFALEQGREVMAVPGNPTDPRAQGCNQLIRDGATLIQSAADIIEAIDPMRGPLDLLATKQGFTPARTVIDASADDRHIIENLLGPSPVMVNELIRQSGASAAIVHTILLELELAGRLERHAGGRVSLSA